MVEILCRLWPKLRFAALLSTVLAAGAAAHEINPSVADLSVAEGQVRVQLRTNLDALLAGVDLSAHSNTEDAPEAPAYTALRAQPPGAVAARAGELLAGWNAVPMLAAGGAPVPLTLAEAEVLPEDTLALPRAAQLILTGPVPEGARDFVFTWPPGGGPLILRQVGVEAPFTGYLAAGVPSAPIPIAGGTARDGAAGALHSGFAAVLPGAPLLALVAAALVLLTPGASALAGQMAALLGAQWLVLALAPLGPGIPLWLTGPLVAAALLALAADNMVTRRMAPWRVWIVLGAGAVQGAALAGLGGSGTIGFALGTAAAQVTALAGTAALIWVTAPFAAPGAQDGYAAAHRRLAWPLSGLVALAAIFALSQQVL